MDNYEKKLFVRTKTWIENGKKNLLFGKGKTEILELIQREGSIAQAAEEMGLNYKKAWTHITILQNSIADELVVSQKRWRWNRGDRPNPLGDRPD